MQSSDALFRHPDVSIICKLEARTFRNTQPPLSHPVATAQQRRHTWISVFSHILITSVKVKQMGKWKLCSKKKPAAVWSAKYRRLSNPILAVWQSEIMITKMPHTQSVSWLYLYLTPWKSTMPRINWSFLCVFVYFSEPSKTNLFSSL